MAHIATNSEREVTADGTFCKARLVTSSTMHCLLRDAPGREAKGLVAPKMERPVLTASKPSKTRATTGPEAMYLMRPGKKGLSFRSA